MEADDMIVLVLLEDDMDESSNSSQPEVKTEPQCLFEFSEDSDLYNLMKTAEKHGQYIPINVNPSENDCNYLEVELKQEIKSEPEGNELGNEEGYEEDEEEHKKQMHDSDECTENTESDTHQDSGKYCQKRRVAHLQRSFVEKLRREHTELKEDKELLINTLELIMRSVKPPPPPRDYYIMTGIMLECVICGSMSESIPAASRHYQDRHGPRYLVCYACGVDFRSTTNLYKHEKRCAAPDASIVLRARAASLGRKGRSRPYLKCRDPSPKPKTTRFHCQQCSAVFKMQSNLRSHENLHRGERPFRCKECPCAYTSHSALARHRLKHTDVQYICDYCNRSFKVKAALVSHIDTHRPLRKYVCEECGRRFAGKLALTLHVNKIHLNLPPPCACPICPRRFPRMSLLKVHMKKKHEMSIITRKMFFKSLPTMSELEVKRHSKIIYIQSNDEFERFEDPNG